jgi:hypothetical protein
MFKIMSQLSTLLVITLITYQYIRFFFNKFAAFFMSLLYFNRKKLTLQLITLGALILWPALQTPFSTMSSASYSPSLRIFPGPSQLPKFASLNSWALFYWLQRFVRAIGTGFFITSLEYIPHILFWIIVRAEIERLRSSGGPGAVAEITRLQELMDRDPTTLETHRFIQSEALRLTTSIDFDSDNGFNDGVEDEDEDIDEAEEDGDGEDGDGEGAGWARVSRAVWGLEL